MKARFGPAIVSVLGAALFLGLSGGRVSPEARPSIRCTDGGCHDGMQTGGTIHSPVSRGLCTTCHPPAEGWNPRRHSFASFSLPEPTRTVCFSCHPGIEERLAGPYSHEPVRHEDCGTCHAPHGSPFPDFLRAPYPPGAYSPFAANTYDLCWGCHDSGLATEKFTSEATGFRKGKRNFHYSHLHKRKGIGCRACHETHDSAQLSLIRGVAPPGAGSWSGILVFERTPSGGRCISGCHTDISYSR